MVRNSNRTSTQSQTFLHEDFLLETDHAEALYHQFAKDLPIIDYHCHLPPAEIARDKGFANLTEVWLKGDHYKWRAMRTNGVNEHYITGKASDWEKFEKWAETVPFTMRNPLYHWSHLELLRYFGVDELLKKENARAVYDHCNHLLQRKDYFAQGLMERMNVETICTTDDPIDNLAHHQALQNSNFAIRILPTFRPDKAILIGQEGFNDYIQQLGRVAGLEISNLTALLTAIEKRMDYFGQLGCRLSDHGLEKIHAVPFTDQKADEILAAKLRGATINPAEEAIFESCMLYHLGQGYHRRGWTMQLHLGALRNNNSRMMRTLGPDTGFDSIGDFSQAQSLAQFLDRLDQENTLPQTIIYNLNPRDNEVMATMIGNFNDGSVAGKIQYGSGWWFLDQLDGMEKQMNALSNMGLISRFIGMLTDSRSFLSYPRHEYFRRLLCNMFGNDIEKGLLPNDQKWIGKIIQDICYYNAKRYFQFD